MFQWNGMINILGVVLRKTFPGDNRLGKPLSAKVYKFMLHDKIWPNVNGDQNSRNLESEFQGSFLVKHLAFIC